jgi:hypothetical protein
VGVLGLMLLAPLVAATGAPAAEPAPSSSQTVLLLAPPESAGIDARALLEAAAVYTRDLRLTIRTAPVGFAGATPAEVAALVRAEAARVAFWCRPLAARREVVLYTVDGQGTVTRLVIEGSPRDGPELYRVVALKLRAGLLAAPPPRSAATVAGARSPPARGAPSIAPAAVGWDDRLPGSADEMVPPDPAPAPVPGDLTPPAGRSPPPAAGVSRAAAPIGGASGPAPAAARRRGASLVMAYQLSAPMAASPVRQALAVEVIAPAGGAGELGLGVEIAGRAVGTVAAGSVSVLDVPVRAGFRLRRRSGRWSLALGPFAALHLLWATATAADQAGAGQADTFTVAGGAGVEGLVRVGLGGALALEVRLLAEEVLPRTRFWVRDTPAFETAARLGLAVGLVLPAP